MDKHLDSLTLGSFQSHLSEDEVVKWFSKKLNRFPEAADVYAVAKACYQRGEYAKAVQALELYTKMPGCQTSGVHLLGYSYYMVGKRKRALEQFKLCVKEKGFDADWQLLVEIQLELEEQPQERGIRDSGGEVAIDHDQPRREAWKA